MHNRRKAERREEIVDDPYKGTTSIAARELEIVFEQIMGLNEVYDTKFDSYIQPQIINTLQDLEDFVGTLYNNYNANVEVKKNA